MVAVPGKFTDIHLFYKENILLWNLQHEAILLVFVVTCFGMTEISLKVKKQKDTKTGL